MVYSQVISYSGTSVLFFQWMHLLTPAMAAAEDFSGKLPQMRRR